MGDILGQSKSQMSITTPDAEELNNFFVSVGPKLANVFKENQNEPQFKEVEKSMFLVETTPDEVYEIITNLKNKKSTDYLDYFIKKVNPSICSR